MIKALDALNRYGQPEKEAHMTVWDVPAELELGAIPNKIYCNKDLVLPLNTAFKLIKDRGLGGCIKTWDGCFNIRRKRNGSSMSLHSWGLAIDINAGWNRMGRPSTQDPRLVQAFKDAGFAWGGDWTSKVDAMHFELARLP